MLRHNQDPSYVPESGNMEDAVCCDDDNFRMEKFSCLGDASTYDANTNFYYTGRYEADLFEEEYEWKGVPHLMKEADEYLNDMFEDYDQERGRYRDSAQLQIVDTSGDGLPEGRETTCTLNDLVYPDVPNKIVGEDCAARENYCVSNTMRGALTRRHCPDTCNKYVIKNPSFDPTMWSPASYLNCKRWCKDGSTTTSTTTTEPTTASTTTPEPTTTSTMTTTTPEPTTTSRTTTEPTTTDTSGEGDTSVEGPTSSSTTSATTEAPEEDDSTTMVAFASASAAGVGAAAIGGGIYAA